MNMLRRMILIKNAFIGDNKKMSYERKNTCNTPK